MDENCSNVHDLINSDITFIVDDIEYYLTPEEYILKDEGMGSFLQSRAKTESGTKNQSCMAGFMPLDIPNDEDGF